MEQNRVIFEWIYHHHNVFIPNIEDTDRDFKFMISLELHPPHPAPQSNKELQRQFYKTILNT